MKREAFFSQILPNLLSTQLVHQVWRGKSGLLKRGSQVRNPKTHAISKKNVYRKQQKPEITYIAFGYTFFPEIAFSDNS